MNLIVKACLLYSLAQKVSYSQEISLLSSPPTNASYCPGTVNFTCIGTKIPIVLNWRVNGSIVGYYEFDRNDVFPQPIIPYAGIPDWFFPYVSVSNASSSRGFVMNITSKLIGNVDTIQGTKIQCASQKIHSEIYYVTTQEPPPPPSIGSCFLNVSPQNSEVIFQWSSTFTNQYAVDNYHVTATHGSSSSSLLCSYVQLISSNKNYSCSGLEEDMQYFFIVTAINCGDQEGDSHLFSIYVAKKLSSVFNVTMLHWHEGAAIQLTWNQTVLGESILKHSGRPGKYDFSASIQLLISDSTGRIMKNESFPQYYDGYCNAYSECSISQIVTSTESRDYMVSITTAADRSDQCNMPSNTYMELIPAFSSEMISSTLTRINNTVYAFCNSSIKDISTCSIQYGKNPWYQNLSSPVIGPMNRIFPLPIVETTSNIYYYQVAVLINSTLMIIVRSYYQSWGENPNDVTRTTAPINTFSNVDNDITPAAPTYTIHNVDNDMNNREMLEWYQGGIGVLAFVVVIISLVLAIVISLLLHLKVKGKGKKTHASCHSIISSPTERKDVKCNLALSPRSCETGAHGRTCEEDVIYDEVQKYPGDHYEQCTTKATGAVLESVNNNTYYVHQL